jgi:hypothetical protein
MLLTEEHAMRFPWAALASLLAIFLGGLAHADTSPEALAVYEKMKNGIHVGHFDTFPNNRDRQNNKEYMDLIHAAGFKSIRFFHNAGLSADAHAGVVRDALARGLVVDLCMFGMGLSNEGGDPAKRQYVERWKEIAAHYRDYDRNLVFEMYNEPALTKNGDPIAVMDWINAAVAEIRAIGPRRILLIGGPSYNQPNLLCDYVTPQYLTYRTASGIQFVNDDNIIGAFHHYAPGGYCMPKKKNTLADFPTWKQGITSGLDKANEWCEKWNRRAVLTEWGAQWPIKDPLDLNAYTSFFVDELKTRKFAWIYYCGSSFDGDPPFSDHRDWSIFRFKTRSWHKDLVSILTGADTAKPNAAPVSVSDK